MIFYWILVSQISGKNHLFSICYLFYCHVAEMMVLLVNHIISKCPFQVSIPTWQRLNVRIDC